MKSLAHKTHLRDNEVHVWYVPLDDVGDPSLLSRYRQLLSHEERDRLSRLALDKDRHQFIVARGLLRTVLSRYADVPPTSWTFLCNRYGKPEISCPEHHTSIRFNLSHTHGVVACAVSRYVVGIDVERTDRPTSMEVARRFFAPPEASHLERLPNEQRPSVFIDYWTLKEAYIKARGMGMQLPLDEFWFHLGGGLSPSIQFAPTMQDDPSRWQFFQYIPGPRHKLAVAVCRPVGNEVSFVVRRTVPLAPEPVAAPGVG
jgi:4'-phosphopantetheinyl transferase